MFEHHAGQGTKEALEAFLHEYKITFPVGIDAPSDSGRLPKTMTEYNMQGTPTLLLIDREGRLRKHKFGMEQDLTLGAEIMALMRESEAALPKGQMILKQGRHAMNMAARYSHCFDFK